MAGGKKEPIVVAQIMGKWHGGGVEAVIMNYYRHIDRTKVQFDFICDEDSTNIPYDEIRKLGGNIIICPKYQHLFKYMKFLKKLFKEKRYKIVHSNINTLSVFPLRAAKKAGVPVRIAHSHSTSSPKEWKRNVAKNILRRFSRKYATDYYACSEAAGRYQFGDKALNEKSIKIVPNAIEMKKFQYDPNAWNRIRKELGFNDGDFVIGNIGRMTPVKNQLFLIDAFSEYRKENPDAKLLIIGEGEMKKKIIDKVKSLCLEKDVRIEGYRSNCSKYYSAMDLFALPSLYEGFGMVAVEAQAAGLKVIASETVPVEANIGSMLYSPLDKRKFLYASNKRKSSDYDVACRAKRIEEEYLRCL